MSSPHIDWRVAPMFHESRRDSMLSALNSAELHKTLGQFYQDLVLRGIPSPDAHVTRLREILEGKTQSGT